MVTKCFRIENYFIPTTTFSSVHCSCMKLVVLNTSLFQVGGAGVPEHPEHLTSRVPGPEEGRHTASSHAVQHTTSGVYY